MCKTIEDSHDHLFFQCKYSNEVWTAISRMARINNKAATWNGYVSIMSTIHNHNSIWSIIKKLCFAAAVYYLWQERNYRIFRQEERDYKTLVKIIQDEIRFKLMSVKTKNTRAVREASTVWEVKIDCS